MVIFGPLIYEKHFVDWLLYRYHVNRIQQSLVHFLLDTCGFSSLQRSLYPTSNPRFETFIEVKYQLGGAVLFVFFMSWDLIVFQK